MTGKEVSFRGARRRGIYPRLEALSGWRERTGLSGEFATIGSSRLENFWPPGRGATAAALTKVRYRPRSKRGLVYLAWASSSTPVMPLPPCLGQRAGFRPHVHRGRFEK